MFDATAPLSTSEQATLALQQANLEATLAGNEIVFWIGLTQAAVALVVGLIQAGVVGWGIRYMSRMGERREQQHAERHTETLEAFRLQATTSREQHLATLEALRQQSEAFRTLIERTAPGTGPSARFEL